MMKTSRAILTTILLGGSAISFFLDWSSNHLLSPEWHPHARFHGGLLLFLLAGVSLTGTWLLWRKSQEPQIALTVATLIALSFWTPLLYVGSLVPGSTPWAGTPGREPHIGGQVFYPNMAVAALFVLLTLGAWWLGRRASQRAQAM
ncbi:MAG: hypothetical protein JWO80_5756 [Bryobacterales bacterium]|nr:hypothetical protein [Bryobacterales bacterium]